MTDPDPEAIVRAIAAGDAVDWRGAEAHAPDSDSTALLQELRVVAGIASFHKSSPPQLSTSRASSGCNEWGSLRITRSLGSGSFGDVYEAHDPALDRPVALKLLRSVDRTGDSVNAEAIEEGRVLARVRHPHVVTVFGAARVDGRAGIWMELIRGRTLAQRVNDSGPMDARDAASAVRDVCLGLAAIHDAGILHRDIKAQNVMQDETGRIVLMDLGASFDPSRAAANVMAGTPAYLAPEIVRGESATPRSDIYSVGVLLFYLTTGGFPVRGASLDELRDQHERGNRVNLGQAGATLPRSLASIIERALAPTPADRFASARDAVDALDRFLRSKARRTNTFVATVGVVVLAILAALTWARWRKPSSSEAVAIRPQILVGAFDNHTGKDLFDRTIQAGLEYELSRFALPVTPSIRVDDALKVLKRPIDTPLTLPVAREVAQRDTGIQWVIVGSVDTVGDSAVITTQIVDPATGAGRTLPPVHVASDAEAPQALRELTSEIRQSLGRTRDEGGPTTGPTISLESLRDYSDALRLGNRGTLEDWRGALEHARQAVDRDQAFALAQIWLARCEIRAGKGEEGRQTAAAAEALAKDEDLPVHDREWVLGSASDFRGEADRTLAHYEAVLQTQPDNFWIINRLISLYPPAGSIDRTVTMASRAAELRPNDLNQQIVATTWLLRAGRDAVTIASYETRALQLFDTQTPKPQGDLSIALLAPAHLAWRVRDAAATTTELTGVATNPRVDVADKLANAVFGRVAGLYLAMGQIASARAAIGRMDPAENSEVLLATADYYAGDLSSDQQHFDRVCNSHDDPLKGIGHFPACMMFLIHRGRLDDAEAFLKRAEAAHWEANSPPVRAALGALAVAQHRPDDAIKILSGMTDPIDKDPQYYRVMRALSDAWLQKQNRETAISTLRSALTQRTYSLEPGASLEATALSFRLAALYRSAGATNEAAAVEKDAMRGLERADPGFVDRLKALGAEGLGR